MSFLKWLNPFRKEPKPEPERTYDNGDRLTNWEVAFASVYNADRLSCPDCETGRLVAGPSGVASVNYRCNNCSSKFNLALPYWGERISDSSLKKNIVIPIPV